MTPFMLARLSAGTKIINQGVPPCGPDAYNQSAQEWLVLVVKNTTNTRKSVALFDGSGAFQLKNGIQTQDGVTVESTSTDYQLVLNNLASNEAFCFAGVSLEASGGSNPSLQFENALSVYSDVNLTNGSALKQQIIPSVYKDPNRQQQNEIIVSTAIAINRKDVMRFNLEADTTYIMRFAVGAAIVTA